MSPQRRKIWVTRAEPGASATARRVAELGLEPLVQPLLAVRPMPNATIDLAGAAALAFTSANGVAAFAALSAERGLAAFTVGDATAEAARAAGFADVASARGDVDALAALLTSRAPHLSGDVVYPTAAAPARDLAALVADAGIELRTVAVYETVATPPPETFVAQLADLDGVLLHSARAAAVLATVLSALPATRLVAYAISAKAAAPLDAAQLAGARIADAPTEAALLAQLAAG